MRISSIQPYYSNTNTIRQDRSHTKTQSLMQTPDTFLRSVNFSGAKAAVRDFQQEAIKLFQDSKYAVSANTLKNIRSGISELCIGRCSSHYWIEVNNEHQLNFIENVLAHNIEPNHPLISNEKFVNFKKFEEILNNIQTKEHEEAKSTAFNLYMKHADVFNPDLLGTLLYFSSTDEHKKYLDFIDANYDDIAKRPNISIRHLENYLFYPIYHMGFRNKDYAKKVEGKYENLWNYATGKIGVKEAFGYKIPENIDKNSLEYTKHVKCMNYIVSDNKALFKNLKSRPHLSQKKQNAINNLRRITNEYKIPITMRADDIMGVLIYDENISPEDLIYIDRIFDGLKEDDRWDFLNNLFKTYNNVQRTDLTRPVNYNEFNRKFLIYMTNDAQGSSFKNIKPKEVKEKFLNQSVLESITTPERLNSVKNFYNYCFNSSKMPLISGDNIAILIQKYNLNGEDLIGINEEITNSKGYLDYDKWDKIATDIKNGTFQRITVEK